MDKDRKMKSELKKEIGLRMRKVRKALGYTQEKMVSYFDIGRANYSRIEKGEVLPNCAVLNSLHTQFAVSLDWLIADSGKMFVWSRNQNPDQNREKKEQTRKINVSEYGKEVRELLITINKVPMVKHAILGFFLEYKAKHKEIIQRTLEECEPLSKMNKNSNNSSNTIN
jgi:transcriptional regulator with XRE-family HTH domain